MTDRPASDKQPVFRVGHGYDVHRFGDGDHIIMAGTRIPFDHGFIAHSDGDVLIHALCDALLGSVAAGDIGQHFPDTDAQYENIDSTVLLEKVLDILSAKHACIGNIDITIIAQKPKMAPHIGAMRKRLAGILKIDIDRINIKATTTEGLGFQGRSEGIAVHSVALVYT